MSMTQTRREPGHGRIGEPLLEVDSISKYFGSVIAIKDISMFVASGEVTCLLGDNGAGKSTLIKTLSGVHKPSEGEYLFDGEEIAPRLAARRARARDRHRLPGPGDDPVDVDLAELLPRLGADEGLGSVPPIRREEGEGDRRGRSSRRWGSTSAIPTRPVGHPLGRRAAVGRDRPRRVLRREGADPRRADRGARREAGRRRPPLHRAGQATRRRPSIFITHNPHHAYPVGDHFVILRRGQVFGDFAEGGAHARTARPDDGRRRRARDAGARARTRRRRRRRGERRVARPR